MTTPIKGTQTGAGTAALGSQAAKVEWTSGTTKEEVYIDLGFVPTLAFLHSDTTDNAWIWYDGLPAANAIAVGDGAVDAVTVTRWSNTLVPSGKFYIRANTVYTSTASDDDYITGLKVDDGFTDDSDTNTLIAIP